jgi:hypothetical protein
MPMSTVKDHPNRMAEPAPRDPVREQRDLERVAILAKARLVKLGVHVDDRDSTDDLIGMMEAIERFENVVRGRGGDLMVDEPPKGSRPQPDGEGRALPMRAEGEPPQLYIDRLDRAAEQAARI